MPAFTNIQLADDFAGMFMGRLLGSGIYRSVYAHASDRTLVIKVENGNRDFSNVLEWTTWEHIKNYPEASKWLAPCIAISPHGRVMLQKRTNPIEAASELPLRVPAWLTDLKRANWGHLGKQVVCHDYANTLIWNELISKRTRKACFFNANTKT